MRFQVLSAIVFVSMATQGARAVESASQFGGAKPACVLQGLKSDLLGPTEEERRLLVEVKGNLKAIKIRSKEESQELNAVAISTLKKLPILRASARTGRKGTFTRSEIDDLYKKVAGNEQVKKTLCGGRSKGGYAGSEDGFCFARAMAVHLKALQSGANNGNIRKIWVVGDLRSKSGEDFWYHAATAVRSDTGEWYVIDHNLNRPMSLDEWHKEMQWWNRKDGRMRVFITPAKRFLPTQNTSYNREMLEKNSEFFADFMDELYKENTGRPGPWTRIRSDQRKRKFVQNLVEWLGMGAGAAITWGIGSEVHHVMKPATSPTPASAR
jgi:hypothetical protein